MMKAVIFTHPPDYLAASYTARSLRRLGIGVTMAVDVSDPDVSFEDCRVVRTGYPRGGNLNGMEAIQGQMQVLWEAAAEDPDPYVLKVDSDALLFGLSWLDGKAESVVGLKAVGAERNRSLFGFCYAVRTQHIPALLGLSARLPNTSWCPEDITMGILGNMLAGTFVHENKAPGVTMGSYNWNDRGGVSDWLRKLEVIVFQRNEMGPHGRMTNRRDVSRKMREFLEHEDRLPAAHAT